jgi:hypothetical protein
MIAHDLPVLENKKSIYISMMTGIFMVTMDNGFYSENADKGLDVCFDSEEEALYCMMYLLTV